MVQEVRREQGDFSGVRKLSRGREERLRIEGEGGRRRRSYCQGNQLGGAASRQSGYVCTVLLLQLQCAIAEGDVLLHMLEQHSMAVAIDLFFQSIYLIYLYQQQYCVSSSILVLINLHYSIDFCGINCFLLVISLKRSREDIASSLVSVLFTSGLNFYRNMNINNRKKCLKKIRFAKGWNERMRGVQYVLL